MPATEPRNPEDVEAPGELGEVAGIARCRFAGLVEGSGQPSARPGAGQASEGAVTRPFAALGYTFEARLRRRRIVRWSCPLFAPEIRPARAPALEGATGCNPIQNLLTVQHFGSRI